VTCVVSLNDVILAGLAAEHDAELGAFGLLSCSSKADVRMNVVVAGQMSTAVETGRRDWTAHRSAARQLQPLRRARPAASIRHSWGAPAIDWDGW
jgi:hypothetical protein